MPVAYVMAGIPGAGKSTYVDRHIANGEFPADAFILDPDRTMQSMPDYQRALKEQGEEAAFEHYELPARERAYQLFEQALSKGRDIIKDMGCTRAENIEMVRRMKQAGYEIHVIAVITDVETAFARTKNRPRHTPRVMIEERHQALQERLPELRDLANTYSVIDGVSGQ